MNDDFNTSIVMAHLNEGLRYLNSSTLDDNFAITVQAWVNAAKILGLFALNPKQFDKELFNIKNKNLNLDVARIEQLIADRNNARNSKNWNEADRCRDELNSMGVVIEDTPNGTEWKIK